jgi:N-methylhydantoinase A
VGGTFTDAVADSTDGRHRWAKVHSTPDDPARGLGAALADLAAQGVDLPATALTLHGTTVATNALLEGRLARVVLLCTAGFRDLVEIGSGTRHEMYDLWAPRPRQLVERADRLEVRERLRPDGNAVEELTADELARVAAATADRRPESVAIACLFSYANPGHEQRLAEAVARRLPGTPITVSSAVASEFRELPRTMTTVVAAGLRPIVDRHLTRATSAVRAAGIGGAPLVMLSNGGLASAERAAAWPHRLILSGPAGGVAGAVALGLRLGLRELISLDMGGTSADVALVRDGRPPTAVHQELEGIPLLTPAVDIVSAGAGGGSIASVEPGRRLQVGPRSAGAQPGPASYGLGGESATVTDAHLLVGDLAPSRPLAGSLRLDPEAAGRAMRPIGRALRLPTDRAAQAVLAVARAHVARTIRRVSIERGRDPRGMTLVAFGGAGPLHAAALLRDLRLGEVIVPVRPGLGSADGLLAADLRVDASQTLLRRLDPSAVTEIVAWLRTATRDLRRQLRRDGVPVATGYAAASVDCRYLGQGYELSVPLPGITAAAVRGVGPAFHGLHEATYGHAAPGEPVEAVTLRLSVFGSLGPREPVHLPRGAAGGAPRRRARLDDREVLLPAVRERRRVRVWDRDELRAGDRLAGPCLIEQLDATTLVLPGILARVGPDGELRLREAAR